MSRDPAWEIGFLQEVGERCLEDNSLDATAFIWGIKQRLPLHGTAEQTFIPLLLRGSADVGAQIVREIERLLHDEYEANGELVQKLWDALLAQQRADYKLHEARSLAKEIG